MNILYSSDTAEIIGGGEISLLNFLEYIDRARYTPYLLVPCEGDLTSAARALGVEVIIQPYRRVTNPCNLCFTVRYLRSLSAIIRRYAISLIHVNSGGGVMFLAGIACRVNKIPLVSHLRVFDSGIISDLIQGMVSTKVIMVSRALQRKMSRRMPRDKVEMIYNGVNLRQYSPQQRSADFIHEVGCAQDGFLVGTVASYQRGKGLDFFVRAAKIVADEIPEVTFVVAGFNSAGSELHIDSLKGLATQLHCSDRIRFLIDRGDVSAILSSLDVFVFPSLIDSFGRVMIEAHASALPVVVFDCGGAREVIEDGKSGFLVERKNYRRMAQKVIFLLKNKEIARAFGLAGRQRAEEIFGIELHARNIESVYKSVAEK